MEFPLNSIDAGSNPLLRSLERRFEIRVACSSPPPPSYESISFDPIGEKDAKDVAEYAFVLAGEFNKLPADLVRKAGLATIALVTNLALEKQLMAGVQDIKAGVLYFDVRANRANVLARRHSIHHEFYHLLSARQSAPNQDPWLTLNANGFEYGGGGLSVRDPEAGKLERSIPGFVNRYSTTASEEDKAEIFACLFVPEEARRLEAFAKEDAIIAAKTKAMKESLALLSTELNESFWERIRKRR
jgi:hypothetical protein